MAARRNVELKASDPDPGRSRAACERIGAGDEGVLRQRDTYFEVSDGRLKLRRQSGDDGDEAHLIHYRRADEPRQRASAYTIVDVHDPDGLESMLATALGASIVVEKRRHLFLWHDVRIHLDEVDGLGSFIELEALAPEDSDLSAEHERIDRLRGELGIADERLCAAGYAQLLAAASTSPRPA
jgi:predicted adenylyl cyclase CyaB